MNTVKAYESKMAQEMADAAAMAACRHVVRGSSYLRAPGYERRVEKPRLLVRYQGVRVAVHDQHALARPQPRVEGLLLSRWAEPLV